MFWDPSIPREAVPESSVAADIRMFATLADITIIGGCL